VVSQLIAEGLLEVRPGVGTVVRQPPAPSRADRSRLLGPDVEQLTVEAMKLGLSLEDLQSAVADSWRSLNGKEGR